jgi:hypothetical protein
MADLIQPVSLTEHIRLVARLRWRIMLNGLRKKNNLLDLIAIGFVSVFGAIVILGPAIGFYFAGHSFVSGRRLAWLALPLWLIFMFWQAVPIFAAGFGTSFEFKSLLRFPFKAGAFYIIGLAYGLSDFPAMASIVWLTAFTAGATSAMPSVLPMMLAVVLLFILLCVTSERLLGSWLEKLLARRRSKEIFFALFILSMFSLQFIAPIQARLVSGGKVSSLLGLVKYLAPFPPSLAARAITGAVRHDFADIAIGLLGLSAYVALATALLWQRFAAQYRGEELSEAESVGVRARRVRPRTAAVAAPDPDFFSGLLSPAVGAMARKEISYFLRNGFAFLLLLLPPAQVFLFSSRFAGWHPIKSGKPLNMDFLFPGMMAYTILVLMGPAYNAFAYESRGIQTYYTAPLKFADIFAGKNLVSATVVALEVVICGTVLALRTNVPKFPTLVATAFALIFTIAAQLPVANWASLSFPRKLEFGSMRSQRNSGVSIWIMFGMQMSIGLLSAIILWTGRLTHKPWLGAEAFAILAAAAVGGYFASLQSIEALAERKRESLIEALCR